MFKGSGSRFTSENYRSVALTTVVSKVMESIIKDSILLHLSVASLLSPHQHGFLPKRSTLSALLTTILIDSILSALIVTLLVSFSILTKPLTPYHIVNYFGNCHIILSI